MVLVLVTRPRTLQFRSLASFLGLSEVSRAGSGTGSGLVVEELGPI